MTRCPLFLLLLPLIASCAQAAPRPTCDLAPLAIAGREVTLTGARADLGDPDDAAAPTAWQGPIRITRDDGRSCTTSDEVGLISRPLFSSPGGALLVSTYSGGNQRLFLISQADCGTLWRSPVFSGQISVEGSTLTAGKRTYRLDPDCRPGD